ncbi:MAG: WXG100 family type VII secretion target [Ktedonobacteraceae bacterium]|nr:WXG100 family type VII secretion target [Ktedonobacteraceae bacterium]
MPVIHVDTDIMRQLGQVFVQLNEQVGQQFVPQIQNHAGQLESDWQGISRQRYEQMYQEWRSTSDQLMRRGEDLGRRLQNAAQQFENVDQQG